MSSCPTLRKGIRAGERRRALVLGLRHVELVRHPDLRHRLAEELRPRAGGRLHVGAEGRLRRLVDRDGTPLRDTTVWVEQVGHAFGFGNIGFDFIALANGAAEPVRRRYRLPGVDGCRLDSGSAPGRAATASDWARHPWPRRERLEDESQWPGGWSGAAEPMDGCRDLLACARANLRAPGRRQHVECPERHAAGLRRKPTGGCPPLPAGRQSVHRRAA
jgi:hypothetical protein